MDVDVAAVPTARGPGRGGVVWSRLDTARRRSTDRRQLDLDAPSHLGVRIPEVLCDDRGHPQLHRPLAGDDRSGQEAAGGLAGHVPARDCDVLRLGLEALGRQDHVRVARPSPPAELARPVGRAAPARLVDAQVERVAGERSDRRVVAVLDPHGGRTGRHVERQHHEAALEARSELTRDHLRGAGSLRRGRKSVRAPSLPRGRSRRGHRRRRGAPAQRRRSRMRFPSVLPDPEPPQSPGPYRRLEAPATGNRTQRLGKYGRLNWT